MHTPHRCLTPAASCPASPSTTPSTCRAWHRASTPSLSSQHCEASRARPKTTAPCACAPPQAACTSGTETPTRPPGFAARPVPARRSPWPGRSTYGPTAAASSPPPPAPPRELPGRGAFPAARAPARMARRRTGEDRPHDPAPPGPPQACSAPQPPPHPWRRASHPGPAAPGRHQVGGNTRRRSLHRKLNKAAYTAGGLAAAGHLDKHHARTLLREAAEKARPWQSARNERIIDDALAAGSRPPAPRSGPGHAHRATVHCRSARASARSWPRGLPRCCFRRLSWRRFLSYTARFGIGSTHPPSAGCGPGSIEQGALQQVGRRV